MNKKSIECMETKSYSTIQRICPRCQSVWDSKIANPVACPACRFPLQTSLVPRPEGLEPIGRLTLEITDRDYLKREDEIDRKQNFWKLILLNHFRDAMNIRAMMKRGLSFPDIGQLLYANEPEGPLIIPARNSECFMTSIVEEIGLGEYDDDDKFVFFL